MTPQPKKLTRPSPRPLLGSRWAQHSHLQQSRFPEQQPRRRRCRPHHLVSPPSRMPRPWRPHRPRPSQAVRSPRPRRRCRETSRPHPRRHRCLRALTVRCLHRLHRLREVPLLLLEGLAQRWARVSRLPRAWGRGGGAVGGTLASVSSRTLCLWASYCLQSALCVLTGPGPRFLPAMAPTTAPVITPSLSQE